MLDPKLLVLLHAAATLFMCGVIAMVQIVHYPLFNMVGRDQFAAYENAHTNLITLVVGPAMLLEAACVLGLLIDRPGSWLVFLQNNALSLNCCAVPVLQMFCSNWNPSFAAKLNKSRHFPLWLAIRR
jgi:hypothetical protein